MHFARLFQRLTLGVVLLGSAPALAGKGRVALHPVVVIGGGVPESAAAAMTAALVDELKGVELTPVLVQDLPEPAPAAPVAPAPQASPSGLQKLAEGRKALRKLRLPKAIALLEKALPELRGDTARTADAGLLLAEAYYRRGDEAKGRKAFELVARAAPDTRIDAKKYPPVFVGAFKEVRAKVAKESKPQATAPVVAEAPVATPGVSPMHEAIAENRCDVTLRTRAVALARTATADLIVVLGIANGDRLFTVGGFVGQPRSGLWAALPVMRVDADMLSATIEGGKVAREIAEQAKRFQSTPVEGSPPFVEGAKPLVAEVRSPTTDNRSPITDDGQPTTDTRSPIADNRPPTTDSRAPITDRRPISDTTDFALMAPPEQAGPITRASASEQLERDATLAADMAALQGYSPVSAYDDAPLAATAEVKRGGITSRWWFWAAVGVGAVLAGGASYHFLHHERASDTLQVQAAW